MKLKVYILGISCFITAVSCKTTQKLSETRNAEYKDLQEMVEKRNFEIVNDFANPSLGNSNINLLGNPNYIRFMKDSVEIDLPYFGYGNAGGSYGSEIGVNYKGLAKDLKITEKPSKNRILIEFKGTQENEVLDFNITLFSNQDSNTLIYFSHRSTISYRGEVSKMNNKN